jgi:hypothetical protein
MTPIKSKEPRPSFPSRRPATCRSDMRSPTMSVGPPAATAAELWTMAQRARALAHDVPDDVMSARLLEIAAELEAQADAQKRQNPP